MRKIYFFWDCDEVLIATMHAFRKFVFEKWNVLLPEDLHDFEKMENQLGIHRDELLLWWSLFNTSDYLLKGNFVPHKEILDFILWLSTNGFESHIITSRPEDECRVSTERWKGIHFGKSISTVQFCNTYSVNPELQIRKKSEAIGEFITDKDFFFFVDDTHTHAIEVAQAYPNNSIVYLLEKSWNRNRALPYLRNLGRVQSETHMINSMLGMLEHMHPEYESLIAR